MLKPVASVMALQRVNAKQKRLTHAATKSRKAHTPKVAERAASYMWTHVKHEHWYQTQTLLGSKA